MRTQDNHYFSNGCFQTVLEGCDDVKGKVHDLYPALWFKNLIKDFGKFLVVPFQYPDCIFLGFNNFFLFLDLCFQRGDKPVTAGKSLLVIWLHILAPLSEKSITESMKKKANPQKLRHCHFDCGKNMGLNGKSA